MAIHIIKDYRVFGSLLLLLFLSVVYVSRKSSSQTVAVIVTPSMTLVPSIPMTSATTELPPYCSNQLMNFEYSLDWNFTNIHCVSPPKSELFISSLRGDTYWITTMLSHDIQKDCTGSKYRHSGVTDVTTSEQICQPTGKKGHRRYEFALGIDDAFLTAQTSFRIPYFNYDSRTVSTFKTPVVVKNPSGKIFKTFDQQSIGATVHEWLRGVALDGGLNDVNKFARKSDSQGKARHRIVGLDLSIDVVVRSVPIANQFFRFATTYGGSKSSDAADESDYHDDDDDDNDNDSSSPSPFQVEWRLSVLPQWTRNELSLSVSATDVKSTGMLSKEESTTSHVSGTTSRHLTKAHGIRVMWHTLPSEVYVLDWFGLVESLIEVIVVFLLWSVVVVNCVPKNKRQLGGVTDKRRNLASADPNTTKNIRVHPVKRTEDNTSATMLEVKHEEEEFLEKAGRLAPISTPEDRLRMLQGMKKNRKKESGELTGKRYPGVLDGLPRGGDVDVMEEHPEGSLFA